MEKGKIAAANLLPAALGEFIEQVIRWDAAVWLCRSDGAVEYEHNPTAQPWSAEYIADVLSAAQEYQQSVVMCGQGSETVAAVLEGGKKVLFLRLPASTDPTAEERQIQMLAEMAENLANQLDISEKSVQNANEALNHIEKISLELSQAYEEIVLLYKLSSQMKISRAPAEFLQQACDELAGLVAVEGIGIFLEKRISGTKEFVLTAGSGLMHLDSRQIDIVQMYLTAELALGKPALLDSAVAGPMRYEWPAAVRSVLAVPLGSKERMVGILVAVNALQKADFDSTDVKLFSAVADQCAVFLENNRLFDELKALFAGSLKALTNSIDAKDQYTRGHSERVAFIARWIAEQMAASHRLSAADIHTIYLAGLLHDIGKIGIGENVLRKKDKLTDQERAVICSHPRIGATILSEIRQMDKIVPGVLYHHERLDGKGYPDGLQGEQIPLIARIINLADAFDAMTSRRVYRDAMSIRRALMEIQKGSGTQFDPDVVAAFLRSDIDKLWRILQDGFIETWDYSNFSEYGIQAVGALIR